MSKIWYNRRWYGSVSQWYYWECVVMACMKINVLFIWYDTHKEMEKLGYEMA